MPNRRTLTENYDIIAWIARLFLGGAINIVFLGVLSSFIAYYVPLVNNVYQTNVLFTPKLFPTFALLTIIYLISPLVLSICLTKREPFLKVVPPFYISIISIAWMLIYWLSVNNNLFGILVIFGGIVGYVGFFEDMAATSILGIATTRDLIYFEHLRVYADIEVVKARLSVSTTMESLHLSERIEGDAQQGYRFSMKRGMKFANIISLCRDKNYPDLTNVKVVYFERSRYNLRFSPRFNEYIFKNSGYIHDVFLKREPILPPEVVVALTNTAIDPLIDSVEDELHGYYARYKRLPARDSVKILGFLILAAITFGLLLSHQPDIYWQLSLFLDIIVYLTEIPELLRRRT